MTWSDTIHLAHPLKDVRRLTAAPPLDWESLLREREQAAFERGRREGENALGQQLIQQRAEMAELQRGILDSLRQALPQVIKESETELIRLALEAARKVVAGLPITGELVESVVREALSQVEDTEEIIIQLHAEDLSLLRKHSAPVLNGVPDLGPLRFTTSAEVTRGGCIVQTRFGLVDARREVKFEQLQQTLA
jgi:flagellar assembly protein FliH